MFVPNSFTDGVAGGTPITAATLNNLENGLVAADITNPASAATTALAAAITAQAPQVFGTVAPTDTTKLWKSNKLAHVRVPAGNAIRTDVFAGADSWNSANSLQEPNVWYDDLGDGYPWHMYFSGNRVQGYAKAAGATGPWIKNTSPILGNGAGGETYSAAYHGSIYLEGIYVYFTYSVDNAIHLARALRTAPDVPTYQSSIFALLAGFTLFGNSQIVLYNGTYYLFYENNTTGWQSGYATATALAGPYTNVNSVFNVSLFPNRTSTISNMQPFREDNRWVVYFHGGPGDLTSSLPTDAYRAFSPDLVTWTVDNGLEPIIERSMFAEVDQIADLSVATGPDGRRWVYWSANDNARNVGQINVAPLIPTDMVWDGANWIATSVSAGSVRNILAPLRPKIAYLTADVTIAGSTGVYTNILQAKAVTGGTRSLVSVRGTTSIDTVSKYCFWQILCQIAGTSTFMTPAAHTGKIGGYVTPSAGLQIPFSGEMEFVGLTPGTMYLYTVQIKVDTGANLNCRAAGTLGGAQGALETMSMRVEDSLYPAT